MQKVEYQNNLANKIKKIYTKKHHDTILDLEKLLEKGVPDLTMSEIASRLKISLRTLYEIAPSKDQLILMTMDKILIKLGKFALDSVSEIQSPIEKLEQYLFIVNQAVGPKFNTFLKDIEKINGSQKMADYHENFISNYETRKVYWKDKRKYCYLLYQHYKRNFCITKHIIVSKFYLSKNSLIYVVENFTPS